MFEEVKRSHWVALVSILVDPVRHTQYSVSINEILHFQEQEWGIVTGSSLWLPATGTVGVL